MAAFLRASGRVCRQIVLYAARNQHSYLRKLQSPTSFYTESLIFPRLTSVRPFSDVISENEVEAEVQESFERDSERLNLDKRPPKDRIMRSAQYERMLHQLGGMTAKGTLLQLLDSILAIEGKFTQLQAYQMLRNCGKELIYESPQGRTDTAHVIWDKLIDNGVQPDIMMYNALLSVYLQNDYVFNPEEILEQIQNAGLEPNLITMTLIIKGFGEKGDIGGVLKVLEFMKSAEMPVTEPVYSALITAYWKSGDMESAKGVFGIMSENGLEPGIDSYTTILRAYAEDGNLEAIDETIYEMQEKKIYPNHTVYLSLIDVFGKCGKIDVIPKILSKPTVKRLVEPDLLSMMIAMGGRGDVDVALKLMDFVPKDNISSHFQSPHVLLLKQVIISNQPIDKVMKVVDVINKQGVMRNVYEKALDLSYGTRQPELSTTIIKEMLAKNIVVKEHYFYPVLASYAQNMDTKGIKETMSLMAGNGFNIDPISLSFIAKTFGQSEDVCVDDVLKLKEEVPLSSSLLRMLTQVVMKSGNVEKLDGIFEYAEENVQDKTFFPRAFVGTMTRSFDPDLAVKILLKMKGKDFTYLFPMYISNLLDNLQQDDKARTGAQFICMMLKQGLQDFLDSRSYTAVMKYLNYNQLFDEFSQLIQVMKEHKIPLDEHQYRQMIRMFTYIGESRAAQFCFDGYKKLAEPDENMYSFLISAYGHCKDGGVLSERPNLIHAKTIVNIYEEMQKLGFEPTLVRSKVYILLSYAALRNLEKAVALKKKFGHLDVTLSLAYRLEKSFLKAFAQKGDTENVLKILDGIKASKNLNISEYFYSTAIGAYKFTGDIDSQRKLFKEMVENGMKPTPFTYDELLATYIIKEDIDGALQIVEEAKENNAYPTSNACIQLANLCGRIAPEKLDKVVNDIIENKARKLSEGSHSFLLHGMVFASVNNGRRDLAEQIMQIIPGHNQNEYGKAANSFANRGDFEAVLKCHQFLDDKNLRSEALLIPLMRAHDVNGNFEAIREVYNKYIAGTGRKPWDGLKKVLIVLFDKYNQEVPFEILSSDHNWQRSPIAAEEVGDDAEINGNEENMDGQAT